MSLDTFSECYRLISRPSGILRCACRVLNPAAADGEYRETADLYTAFPLHPGDTLQRLRDGAVYRVTGEPRTGFPAPVPGSSSSPAAAAPGVFIHRAERVAPLSS